MTTTILIGLSEIPFSSTSSMFVFNIVVNACMWMFCHDHVMVESLDHVMVESRGELWV